MADSSKPPLYHRVILISFATSMVTLSAYQLVRTSPKNKNQEDLQARTKKLIEQLSGSVDVAKASLSTEYLRQVVPDENLLPIHQSPESIPIRKSISDSVGTSMGKVLSAADEASANSGKK